MHFPVKEEALAEVMLLCTWDVKAKGWHDRQSSVWKDLELKVLLTEECPCSNEDRSAALS